MTDWSREAQRAYHQTALQDQGPSNAHGSRLQTSNPRYSTPPPASGYGSRKGTSTVPAPEPRKARQRTHDNGTNDQQVDYKPRDKTPKGEKTSGPSNPQQSHPANAHAGSNNWTTVDEFANAVLYHDGRPDPDYSNLRTRSPVYSMYKDAPPRSAPIRYGAGGSRFVEGQAGDAPAELFEMPVVGHAGIKEAFAKLKFLTTKSEPKKIDEAKEFGDEFNRSELKKIEDGKINNPAMGSMQIPAKRIR